MNQLCYRKLKGWKYQTKQAWSVKTGIYARTCDTDTLSLYEDGLLFILDGYAWDGCSGGAPDFKSTMKASLAHDALYQLMRLGLIPQSCRARADELFYDLLLESGMNKPTAWIYYQAVRCFAGSCAQAGTEKPIHVVCV